MHPDLGWALNPMMGVLIRDRAEKGTQRHRGRPPEDSTGTGATHHQSQNQGLPAPTVSQERHRADSLSELPEKPCLIEISTLGF